jgi:protein PhnA
MAKGYQGNKERLEEISAYGKTISKRAGFKCEWCESRDDLRVWDYKPDIPPTLETLALLCKQCREWAEGRKANPDELRRIRNALWSDIPSVAEGAALVLVQCKESWGRDAIEESCIDETVKTGLLK